jgi:hypothetical protein
MRAGGIVGTRKYADWVYLDGLLRLKEGGQREQVLEWRTSRIDSVNVGDERLVWASAHPRIAPDENKSRKVEYMVSAGGRALVSDTLEVNNSVYERSDTAWLARIKFEHSGMVILTAYQWGDTIASGFKPVYITDTVYVRPSVQEIRGFIRDTAIRVGRTLLLDADLLRAGSSVKELLRYKVSDPMIASVDMYDDGSGILWGNSQGVDTVCAYNEGDADWQRVDSCVRVVVYDPDSVRINLVKDDGDGVLERDGDKSYKLKLSCGATRVRIEYNKFALQSIEFRKMLGGVDVGSEEKLVDTVSDSMVYVVGGGCDKLVVRVYMRGDTKYEDNEVAVVRPLDSTYIYWNEKYAHRLEVVNNPKAPAHAGKCLDLRCFERYQWYRDGVKLEGRVGGVYYDNSIDSISGRFSVQAWYYGGRDSVWICGGLAVRAAVQAGLLVYPNPAGGRLRLKHGNIAAAGGGMVLVYSAGTGSLAGAYAVALSDVRDGEVEIDISALAEGAYVVRFLGESALIVKQKK